MKLYTFYKCPKCGLVAPVADVLLPPVDGQQAQEQPCPKDGSVVWVPVKSPPAV